MVSTSILVDVEESVNELVVKPHKKAKTFSKLIATLLQGYIEDDYIRSYAEGTLGRMHKASVDVLDDALNSMQDSLFSMGILTSELKSSNEFARDKFSERAKKAEEDYSRDSDYIREFKSELNDLRDQNAQIMGMLKDMLAGNVKMLPTSVQEETIVESKVQQVVLQPEPKPVIQEIKPIVEETKVVLEEPSLSPIEVDEDIEEEETIDASDLLASLIMGNEYSF